LRQALAELMRLEGDLRVDAFFEGCRLLLNRPLPLSAYLLKPVQRICQYPLLLQELARVTPAEHADAAATTAAAAAMRAVAERVNEDKRRLEQLPALQRTLDGWSGPDLVATSTRLVREGVLTKVGVWVRCLLG
jgi:hypothetical protein